MIVALESPVVVQVQAERTPLLSKVSGDKLIRCSFKPKDGHPAVELTVFAPVIKAGQFGYRAGKDYVDPLAVAYVDPANVLRAMKINIFANQADGASITAGAMVASDPVAISISPEELPGGGYAATLKSGSGDLDRNGGCLVEAGTQVRAKFEALK